MDIFLNIVIFILLILLAGIFSIKANVHELSDFELKHRVSLGDSEAKLAIDGRKFINTFIYFKPLKSGLVIVLLTLVSIIRSGESSGLVMSLILVGLAFVLSKIKFVSLLFTNLLNKVIDKFGEKTIKKVAFARHLITKFGSDEQISKKIGSRFELQNLIDNSPGLLTIDEKNLIVNGLSFDDLTVREIMTKKSSIKTINKTEFLGPLTLNELHQSGFNRLPVIDGSFDNIIGILNLENLLNLNVRKSMTAEKAMNQKVIYIQDSSSLTDVLSLFLYNHVDIGMVVDHNNKTIGLVTLNDVMKKLFGRDLTTTKDVNLD